MSTQIRAVALASAICITTATGCATNPYVTLDPPRRPDPADGPLGAAIYDAQIVKARYKDMLRAEADRVNNAGSGLIALGSAMLAAAALNAHRDTLIVGGIAGATGYTLANWNQSTSRGDVYILGMEAIDCALAAVTPLKVRPDARQLLDAERRQLASDIRKVNAAAATVDNIVASSDGGADADLVRSARGDVATAKALVASADAATVKVQQLDLALSRANQDLSNTVGNIDTAVTNALKGTVTDLSSIKGAAAGLVQAAQIFVPGLDLSGSFAAAMGKKAGDSTTEKDKIEKQSTAQRKPIETNLRIALGTLKIAAQQLESQARQVNLLVGGFNAPGLPEKLKDCAPNISTDIRVDLPQVAFIEKKAAEQQVTISGGTKPYSAHLNAASGAPVDVRPMDVGDSSFWLVASDKTAAGDSYIVTVKDFAQHAKQVMVVIQAAPGPAPAPKKDDTSRPPAQQGRSKEDVMLIQRALCQKQDGVYGADTTLAVKIFQNETNADGAADGILTDTQFAAVKELAKKGDCPADRRNSYERGLAGGEIASLRSKLDLITQSEKLEDDFRAALAKYTPPIEFTQDKANAVAIEAQKKGQLTLRMRVHLENLKK